MAKFKLLILLAVSPILSCQAQNSFGQDDLANADAVVARLQRGSTEQEKAFEAGAKKYIDDAGERLKKTKSGGAVLKGFGELAVHNPVPRHLMGYSEALLKEPFDQQDIGSKKIAVIASRLSYASRLYASAIAGNTVIKQLNDTELQKVKAEKACVDEYLATKKAVEDCRPLVLLGIR